MKEERDDVVNQIGLLMDGGDNKSKNVITIFSTNYMDLIDPNFLRGKRTGTIVNFTALNAITAEDMIRGYLGDVLKGSCKDSAAKAEEFEIVPAFMAEILDRCKARLVFRPENKHITGKDINAAIESFKLQMDAAALRDPKPIKEVRLYKLLAGLVQDAVEDNGGKLDHVYGQH